MKEFRLTIFGISAALPAHGRHPSAQSLQVASNHYLMDCGEGTQMQMSKYGYNSQNISAIFISHLHGDHYFGLAGLLTSWALNRRSKPVHIFSPPGLKTILEPQLNFESHPFSFECLFHEVTPGQKERLFEDHRVEVFSIQLDHRIPTSGYLFREKKRPKNIRGEKIQEYSLSYEQIRQVKSGFDISLPDGKTISNDELTLPEKKQRTFAYCTDSRPLVHQDKRLVQIDLLYHDTTFMQAEAEQAELTGHSTTLETAKVAKALNVRRLIAGHFSARYTDLSPLLDELKSVFKDSYLAEEGKVFEVEWGTE